MFGFALETRDLTSNRDWRVALRLAAAQCGKARLTGDAQNPLQAMPAFPEA